MVMSLIVTMGIAANNKKKAQQPLKPMNEFVSELMGKMTVQEKIGQLNLLPSGDIQTGISDNSSVSEAIRQGRLGAILNLKGVDNILKVQKMAVEESRLGIPLIFGMDVIHGYETIFPIPLALACSWDIPAIEQSARIAAKEATADGLCWTYSPMVDISIDPRWGRVAEGAGEDPFLGSRIAEAMVRGYQGDLSRRQIGYELPGLSFREFLAFEGVGTFKPLAAMDCLPPAPLYTKIATFFSLFGLWRKATHLAIREESCARFPCISSEVRSTLPFSCLASTVP